MTIFECCAAWASIVGLVVTVWTCWKVKAVKDAIDLHKRERAFRLRLPELLAELEKHVLVISSAANSRKKFDEGVVVSVLAICSNIRNLDTKKNISIIKLQRLEELSKSFLEHIPQDQQLKSVLKQLYPVCIALKEDIRMFLDNTKVEGI